MYPELVQRRITMANNQNRGFISSPTAFIRQIRNNLEEGRYARDSSGFTIFKELLQNADDAGANFVHFGISDGFAQAGHPLLRSPALYVINDGPFEPQDEQNILRFGENSKSLDSDKIGKFGLGLKSLFYLGEAFFYFFHAEKDGNAMPRAGFLNPWSSGRNGDLHREWDDLPEDDLGLLCSELRPLFMKRPCFSIWIPLRQQVHLNGKHPIAKYFPGDKRPGWMRDSTLPASLQSILPLLKNIKTVRGFEGAGYTAREVFCLQVAETSARRSAIPEMRIGQIHTFSGHVDAGCNSLSYCASEVLENDPNLLELHENEFWPDDEGLDPKTGEPLQVKEKAEQHGACCVSIAKGNNRENGKLTIGWSVYLPLGTPAVAALDLPFDVVINMHGYFFTDAGRNGPIGLTAGFEKPAVPLNDRSIKAYWNFRLAEVVTLPLLPETLADALKNSELPLPENFHESVTRAIAESSLFHRAKNAICKKHCWASVGNQRGEITWELHPADRRMLLLPGSSDQGGLAWEVFPGLSRLSDEFVISFFNSPRLCHTAFIADWPAETFTQLIQEVDPTSIVGDQLRLNYLLKLLEFQRDVSSQSVSLKAIAGLTRRILQAAGMDRLLEAKAEYQRLVRSVPTKARVAIDLAEDQGELLQTLLAAESSIVIVPKALEPEDSLCLGRIETADCVSILERIAKTQAIVGNEKQRESVSKVAACILAFAESKADVLHSFGDLPIFVAMDCRKRKDSKVLVSWNQLNGRREKQTLFVAPPSLAYQLQDALADESLLLINSEVFGILFPGVNPKPSCGEKQIIETLSREMPPKLAPGMQRRTLLSKMMEYHSGREVAGYWKCIRYLLHANHGEFDSDTELLFSNAATTGIWRRIMVRILESTENTWRLLDADVASLLSADRCREFGVREIDAELAATELVNADPSLFTEIRPADDEYAELLRSLHDDFLCKKLPIHPTLDGQFVSIEDNCFWKSEREIPPELASAFTILKPSRELDIHHRQLRFTRQLDDAAVLKMALSSPKPERHSQLILDAVLAIEIPSADLVSKLRNTRWLAMADGNSVSPGDVIYLKRLHEPVKKIVASYPGSFYEPSKISQKVLKHNAYDIIEKNCFADTEMSMAIVGELLKTKAANAIGPLSESDFEIWIAAIEDIPESILPASTFIHEAAKIYPHDVHALIRELTETSIGNNRIRSLLDAFRILHGRASSANRKDNLLSVFNIYLAMLLDAEGSIDCLKDQRLLSRAGLWTEASSFAFNNDGLSGRCVLHHSIEHVLDRHRNTQARPLESGTDDEGVEFDWDYVEFELEETGKRLKAYFRPWENSIPTEQIGGFLSLLGDDANVRELAESYLGGNRTLQQTRRKFGLEDWCDKHGTIREDGLTMIAKQRAVVEIVSSPTLRVLNIFGTTIEAERNLMPSSIFIGYGKRNFPFPHRVVDGKRVLCFRLNDIDTRMVNPTDLADLLRDSCVKLIQQAYNQYENQTRFSDAWEELSQSDQLDIFNAQETIIEDALFILLQYGLKSDPTLGPILRDWMSARKLSVERRSGVTVADESGRNPELELVAAKERLRTLLESDRETQRQIIRSVRHRIEKHYQYTAASIPFEIFQNADDTSSQLAEHFNDPERIDAARSFQVFRAGDRVVFAHFGRCINQYPLDKAVLRPKFEDDLWSMLVLNLSSKASDGDSTETAKVTGKYGLGFKSCYLASDSPRVISGRLGFEVNGAMYPKRLIEGSEIETSAISELRDKLGVCKRHATLIELPMDHAATTDVLERFEKLCGFQVVFARHISTIVFDNALDVSWTPEVVNGVDGAVVGNIRLDESEQALSKTRALLLRNEYGSLLLNLDADGFTRFDDEVPTIWVTAPTSECLKTGFVVNGVFNIDVGRAQLSRDLSENEQIASNLGQRLGEQLIDLFHRASGDEHWPALRSQLGLSDDVTKYDLFDSLFEVLCNADGGNSQEPGPKLLHDMVWQDEHSAGSVLVTRVLGLPTRLDGPYRMLVSADSVRYMLSGVLEAQSDLFQAVAAWDSFQSKAPIGSVVSKKKVVNRLARLRPQLLASATSLRLETVLQWELGDTLHCDPDLALRLGKIITRQLIQESDVSDEQPELESLLRKVCFKGRDGKFHQVGKLLCPDLLRLSSDFDSEAGEEAFRAEFAPPSCLLSEEYSDESLVFFDACRVRMEAPARLMADWVMKARELPRQLAALRYIARGQLREALIDALKLIGVTGTWLENLASSEAFRELDERDRWHLRELLPADEQPTIDWSQFVFAPKTYQQLSSAVALRAVFDWWSIERDKPQPNLDGRTYLTEYAYRTFPHGPLANLESDGPSHRRDWMTLLLLGLFHTQGRTRSGQHRQFLLRCEQRGWLNLFSSSERDPQRWMQFIESYLDEQVDDAVYLNWMRQFIGIFQLNRHLDDYIECFLAIDRISEPFALSNILNSKSSVLFQGGGIDAPPLSRQFGLGACFVVRELVRAGVLESPYAHAHCFVPAARVRNLFAFLGCEELEQQHNRWEVSTLIHAFVLDELGDDKANFCGDFDIPFQFITEDDDLQQQLFHERLELDDSDEHQSEFDWDAFTP